MPDQPSANPWRRRLRFSVRALMVLVLVVGGGLGWVIHRARVQRDAVATIRRAGGEVAYGWQWSGGRPVFPRPKPPGPDWLRRILGPDFFDTATYVRLQGPTCDDEALRAACRLPWLEELMVENTAATDAGAEDLRYLTNLRSLDLTLNQITGRPLQHLGRMTELRKLKLAVRLSPVPLRDQDMAFLRRLTKLERLMVPSADLTDAWLVYIEGLTSLKSLQLYDMKLTPEALDHLKGLPNLKASLSLVGTRIPLREPNDTEAQLARYKTHPLLRLNSRR